MQVKVSSVLKQLTIIIIITVGLSGCATVNPLPETLNIVPPSEEVSSDIAAFSGIWKGMWNGMVDTYLVVEEINNKEAQIIIAIGFTQGTPDGAYMYVTTAVLPGPALEWTDPDRTLFRYQMEKGLNEIKGFMTENGTGAKMWTYLKRDKNDK